MELQFKENQLELGRLFHISKNYGRINQEKLKVIEIREGSVTKQGFMNVLEKNTEECFNYRGLVIVYPVFWDGVSVDALYKRRATLSKTFVESLTDMMFYSAECKSRELSGFLLRFVPNMSGILRHDKTFACIFNVVGNQDMAVMSEV